MKSSIIAKKEKEEKKKKNVHRRWLNVEIEPDDGYCVSIQKKIQFWLGTHSGPYDDEHGWTNGVDGLPFLIPIYALPTDIMILGGIIDPRTNTGGDMYYVLIRPKGLRRCALLTDVYRKKYCGTLIFADGTMREVLVTVPEILYESGGSMFDGWVDMNTGHCILTDFIVFRGRHLSKIGAGYCHRFRLLSCPLGPIPSYNRHTHDETTSSPSPNTSTSFSTPSSSSSSSSPDSHTRHEDLHLTLSIATCTVFPSFPDGWEKAECLWIRSERDFVCTAPQLYGCPMTRIHMPREAFGQSIALLPPCSLFFQIPIDSHQFYRHFGVSPTLTSAAKVQLWTSDNKESMLCLANNNEMDSYESISYSKRMRTTTTTTPTPWQYVSVCTLRKGTLDSSHLEYSTLWRSSDIMIPDTLSNISRTLEAETSKITAHHLFKICKIIEQVVNISKSIPLSWSSSLSPSVQSSSSLFVSSGSSSSSLSPSVQSSSLSVSSGSSSVSSSSTASSTPITSSASSSLLHHASTVTSSIKSSSSSSSLSGFTPSISRRVEESIQKIDKILEEVATLVPGIDTPPVEIDPA